MTGDYISQRQADAFDTVAPRLLALLQSIDPFATRRPDLPVPAELLPMAREILAGVMRAVSRETGAPRLLPLHGTPSYGGVAARLRIARAALSAFKERYWFYVPNFGEHVWRTEDWRGEDLGTEDDLDDDGGNMDGWRP